MKLIIFISALLATCWAQAGREFAYQACANEIVKEAKKEAVAAYPTVEEEAVGVELTEFLSDGFYNEQSFSFYVTARIYLSGPYDGVAELVWSGTALYRADQCTVVAMTEVQNEIFD